MAKNKLQDLRDHLFETLEDLREHPNAPMNQEQLRLKIDRAKAVSLVSAQIVDSARLQLEACEITGVTLESDDFYPLSEMERATRARRALVAPRKGNLLSQ